MAVLTPSPAAPADAPAPAPSPQGPACSLQRSGSLWQLGIEAQELTTAIGQLAQQLEADDPEQRAVALAELEAALLAEEGNKKSRDQPWRRSARSSHFLVQWGRAGSRGTRGPARAPQ